MLAQTSVVLAELYGRVTTLNDAAMTDVVVTLANEATGFRRYSPTDAQGEYRFLLLPSGRYTLCVVKNSFRPAERREVRDQRYQNNLAPSGGSLPFIRNTSSSLWGINNLPGRVLASWIVRANRSRRQGQHRVAQ